MANTSPPTLATLAMLGSYCTVPVAGTYFGLSRARAYALHQQGAFPVPVRQVGERYRVLVADLARGLGLDPRWLLEPAPQPTDARH